MPPNPEQLMMTVQTLENRVKELEKILGKAPGGQINLKGVQVTIEASGTMTLKGALIQLN